MKKFLTAISVIISLLFASPVFAYTVQSGDTMSRIARNYHISLDELKRLNPEIQNPDLIYVGQTVHTGQRGTNGNEQSVHTASKPEITAGYSKYELDLLARLVRAEAVGEPYQGKVAVACVVLNRVSSSSFPQSIKEVIYQKGQFQPVQNGEINQPADEDSIKAVHEALNEKRTVAADSLYFYNPETAASRWLDTRPTTLVIGHHVFKK
ncbi:cell wall hydrolase [Neobacillus vireti]|uniref:cell wall hydrolase n=1 Tax=Neobacillus vireti TaxID=220686 RepID=UPI002FFFF9D0